MEILVFVGNNEGFLSHSLSTRLIVIPYSSKSVSLLLILSTTMEETMRFKLIGRCLLFAGLCVYLTSEELWLKNALASNTSRIAFTFSKPGDTEIYVMDADGGNQENLTNHPADDRQPDWSPEGTKIAFVSSRDGAGSQIHIMDADGKSVIRLTDVPGGKRDPDWSPDGQQIAFSVDGRGENYIAVIDADGNNRERLQDKAMGTSWSPDGKLIAFVSWRAWGIDKVSDIYVISADGQELKRVTHDMASQQAPSFSPDGGQIAYHASDKGFGQIDVIDSDGTNRKRLTHNQVRHSHPAWSPDGQTITYEIWEGDLLSTIHLMTSDGKHLKQLRDDHGGSDSQPDISPAGLAVSPTSKMATIWGRLKRLAPNLR